MARKAFSPEQLVESLVRSFHNESDIESALATVLTTAARLENILMTILSSFLIKCDTADNMFKPNGALESFSKCTQMAYCLGFFSVAVRKNLEIIGTIRNHFAHHIEEIDFTDKMAINLCNSLTFPKFRINQEAAAALAEKCKAAPQLKVTVVGGMLAGHLTGILGKVKRQKLEVSIHALVW